MDEKNFNAIMTETQAAIRAYIAGLGVSLDEVDDLAQETYIEFYRGMDQMPVDLVPIRWLKGIARNVCMNHFRRRQRKADHQLRVIAELLSQGEVERIPSGERHQQALTGCLQELSEKNRRMISLRYENGESSEGIARLMELTDAAVRVTLFRLRSVLRQCIENRMQEVR